MTANRFKCSVVFVLYLFILGMVGWQITTDTVFVGKGPAAQNVSVSQGWPEILFEGGVGLIGEIIVVYWFAKDYFPGSKNADSESGEFGDEP